MTIARTLIFCLLPMAAIATPPDSLSLHSFGGNGWDQCYAIEDAPDGGYYLAGETESSGAGGYDGWLIKTDPLGQQQWSHTFGGTDWDIFYAAKRTSDEGVILAGVTESFGNGRPGLLDAWLMKVDSNGDSVFSKSFGSDFAHDGFMAVQETRDGGFICGGWTSSYGSGAADMWLVKTDGRGDSLWSRTYGAGMGDFIYALQETPDGGFILGGETQNGPLGGEDIWIVKTDSGGTIEWQRYFGTELKDVCKALDVGADGSLYFAAYVNSIDAQVPSDFWVAKLTSAGDTVWTRTIGDSVHYEIAEAIKATPDGGCFVSGLRNRYLPTPPGPARMWLARLDAQGDTLWSREWGGSTDFVSYAFAPVGGDSVMLAGAIYSFDGFPDYNVALLLAGPRSDDVPNKPPLAGEFHLYPPYPNPFNSETTFTIDLPTSSHSAELTIFNLLGRTVNTVQLAHISGRTAYHFDANGLAAGIYFAMIQEGGRQQIQKMVLLK